MIDLDQQRAAFAWQRVEQAQKEMGDHYSDYKNLAKGAPAMIMNNGLMQTLAFFHSKDKTHHKLLLGDLRTWMGKQCSMPEEYSALMKELFVAKSSEYRQATEETMHLLRWLRQFADTGSSD